MDSSRPPTPSPPHPSCSAIRELLGALHDPYSRFITPTDFTSMLKYDVSGVGLNLGTAEEFANKTVRADGWWVGAWLMGGCTRGWAGGRVGA